MSNENKPEISGEPEEEIAGEAVEEAGELLTLDALAIRDKGAGALVAKAKVDILKVYRENSIGMTYPEDWTLFKRPDEAGGGITAYLSDAGCKRVLPLWGIDVVPEGGPSKSFVVEKLDVGDDYLITIRGDAYNRTTCTWLRGLEGARGSDDDFVKLVTSPTKRLSHVRKAAFRNLEGNAVRKSTGLDAMPIAELQKIWKPLGRDWNQCNRGRGFGGAATRYGQGGDEISGPKCPACGGGMKLIKPKNDQKWKAFFGCLKGKGKCLGTIKESDWQAELANRAAKDVPQGEAEPHGEAPEELPTQSGQEPDGAQAQIGARKNKALGRIKGNLYEKELKELVLRARTAEDMTDVETVISDREKEY